MLYIVHMYISYKLKFNFISLMFFNKTVTEEFQCKVKDFYSADYGEACEEAHSAPNS